MINHLTSTESNNADPFAALYSAGPSAQLYISGRLTLLRATSGTCGEWLSAPPHETWHRRLDANAFLWLRAAVRRTIKAGKLSPEFADAESRIDEIAAIAIEHGAFTAADIAPHRTAPDCYQFIAGLPSWADEIGPDFLPHVPKKRKLALTTQVR